MVVEVVGVLSLDLASMSGLLSLAWLPLLSMSASYFRYFRVWRVRRLPLGPGVTQWTCSSWTIELGTNGFVQDQENDLFNDFPKRGGSSATDAWKGV